MNAVAVPVHSDSTPYIMSTISDSLLTPLHDGVLDCMELLQKVSCLLAQLQSTISPSNWSIPFINLGSNVKQIEFEANASIDIQSTAKL